MSDSLSVAWADAWIRGAQAVLAEHRMELIDLDRAIGDGDHGENMDRGFKAVVAKLDEGGIADVQGVLKIVASTLMSKVGGAAGPRLAVGKGDVEGAAGSLYYEAPLVVEFADGRPSKRGTIVLRRVNDVPGASEEQLNWRIERTSTLL